MAFRSLKSFFPTADDLENSDLPMLGRVLLVHLNSYEDRVKQHGRLNRGYFLAMLENRNVGLGPLPKEPEYGSRQPAVTRAMMEAWNWLEREGLLIRDATQTADWYAISREGEKLLNRFGRCEQLGLDRVRSELNAGRLGGAAASRDAMWEWVRIEETLQANKASKKPRPAAAHMTLVSETRLEELRALVSPEFDFKKLIRLCEELNISYRETCYFATGMLTRSLLDHVPPIFGKKNFGEVASNYGGQSFKGTMQHLQNASRNLSDGHLHQQIRRKESLPTAQQVNCGQQLDALLEEIVRLTHEKGPTT